MDREIKFRAWNKLQKKYHINCGIHPHLTSDLSYDDDHYKTNDEGRFIINLSMDNYIVEQFTGLYDKNGTEIYEGDELKVHIFTMVLGPNMGVTESEKEFKSEIYIQEFGLYLYSETEGNTGYVLHFDGIHENSFEIIGNIHETPVFV